jgi:hypothetical protein
MAAARCTHETDKKLGRGISVNVRIVLSVQPTERTDCTDDGMGHCLTATCLGPDRFDGDIRRMPNSWHAITCTSNNFGPIRRRAKGS